MLQIGPLVKTPIKSKAQQIKENGPPLISSHGLRSNPTAQKIT